MDEAVASESPRLPGRDRRGGNAAQEPRGPRHVVPRRHRRRAARPRACPTPPPQAYFTPRRLAVKVTKLLDRQPEQRVERRGPPVSAAFDAAGKPTRAATAFADSCGVKVDELTRLNDNKGEFLFCRTTRAGEPAARLLPGIVQAALDALPIARRMRWGAGTAQFVRPVHWVVMLHGEQVIDGRDSRHRRRAHDPRPPLPRPQADRAALAGRLPGRAREGLRARRFRGAARAHPGRRRRRGRRPRAARPSSIPKCSTR